MSFVQGRHVIIYSLSPSLVSTIYCSSLLPVKGGVHSHARSGFDVVVIKNLRVPADKSARFPSHSSWVFIHHNLPCVDRQVGVVETPIKLLLGNRLISGVMVRAKVVMGERLGCRNALLGVEDEHPLKKVDSCSKSSVDNTIVC